VAGFPTEPHDSFSLRSLPSPRALRETLISTSPGNIQPHSGEHLYGFDASFLVCVSLNEPARPKWKARGYGNGQVLLLPDQNLLLILSVLGHSFIPVAH
jgi:hypothetical protein